MKEKRRKLPQSLINVAIAIPTLVVVAIVGYFFIPAAILLCAIAIIFSLALYLVDNKKHDLSGSITVGVLGGLAISPFLESIIMDWPW